ncbi:MAG: hypothetical protein Q7R97_04115 [Candidatus Daviesbacteria bacterium]|nr:hypothetical protein [Candidatus Daviesbacteria bacterium]
MNLFIVILILLSFLEGTIIPFDLVLMILIARSFIVAEKSNYYLAFCFGLLVSLLLGYPLGLYSLIYLFAVAISHIIKTTNLKAYWIVVLPLTFSLLLFEQAILKLLNISNFNLSLLLVPTILMLPVYFIVRVWEERFIVAKDIKLKMGK